MGFTCHKICGRVKSIIIASIVQREDSSRTTGIYLEFSSLVLSTSFSAIEPSPGLSPLVRLTTVPVVVAVFSLDFPTEEDDTPDPGTPSAPAFASSSSCFTSENRLSVTSDPASLFVRRFRLTISAAAATAAASLASCFATPRGIEGTAALAKGGSEDDNVEEEELAAAEEEEDDVDGFGALLRVPDMMLTAVGIGALLVLSSSLILRRPSASLLFDMSLTRREATFSSPQGLKKGTLLSFSLHRLPHP